MKENIPLSDARIKYFSEQGYVEVKNLITPHQVQELRSDYDKVLAGEIHVPTWGDNHIKGKMVQLGKPTEHIPHWRTHPYFLNALAIAQQLMGPETSLAYDQIIYKPPRHPAETEWHQDAGYWKESRGSDHAVTCWLALSPVWKENGGMQFVPGSHQGEIFEHYSVAHRSEINDALEVAMAKEAAKNAIAVALEPGDATFHHCRTLHYTGGNFTDTPRYGLVTHFWRG
ncbi:phytanoyl-CoA dioxygenase family protein [Chloroflexi bacterium TSY]|nr:phytanoyl-CoA dioxygenase family protein [Chloroflexi bacterium TSY]